MKTESNAKLSNGWEIKVAKSFEEVEAVRDIWVQMQHSESMQALNTDIDRYLAVVESLKETVQPYVFVFYYDSDLKAIVVGRIEKRRITCRV